MVAEKNAWDQRSIGRHIGHANGLGIDGVEDQPGPRFVKLGGVGGATQNVVLAVAAAGEVLAPIRRDVRSGSRARHPAETTPIRQAFACLLLALGFAALAKLPGSEVSLLQELQWRWQRSRRPSAGERVHSISEGDDDLRELGWQEEDR